MLLRAAAASALLGLAATSTEAVAAETAERARNINIPISEISVARHERRTVSRTWPSQGEDTAPSDTDHTPTGEDGLDAAHTVRFFMDFTDYWCDDVADAFGLSNQDVARMAGRIVTDQWRQPLHDGHIKDPRHERGLYARRETYAYKSSWPEVETLAFYLATHALWTVAGTLVDTHPVYRDPSADTDEFTQWLRRLLPNRDDGRWLADRRDPPPPSIFTSQNEIADADWVWRLNRNHFAERLTDGDWITVWEASSETGREARQQITVRSAQVAPDRAQALLLALQTAPSNITWRIPQSLDSDDLEREPKVPGFELTGWINVHDPLPGFDDRDPLAASVNYPPPHPDIRTQQLLDLVPDADMRTWTRSDGRSAFRSRVWNDLHEPSNGRQSGRAGDQLQIHSAALTDLLTATSSRLIVVVTIERTHDEDRRHTDSGNDDEFPHLEPSFNVYLIDESGRTHQL